MTSQWSFEIKYFGFLLETDQLTNPEELPISGTEDEISLFIISESHKYFDLKKKRLILTRPLDRDVSGQASVIL